MGYRMGNVVGRDYPGDDAGIETIQVEVDLLDNVIPPGMAIRFMKIDVEGGELGVFRGAARILRESLPVVVFEYGLGGRRIVRRALQGNSSCGTAACLSLSLFQANFVEIDGVPLLWICHVENHGFDSRQIETPAVGSGNKVLEGNFYRGAAGGKERTVVVPVVAGRLLMVVDSDGELYRRVLRIVGLEGQSSVP